MGCEEAGRGYMGMGVGNGTGWGTQDHDLYVLFALFAAGRGDELLGGRSGLLTHGDKSKSSELTWTPPGRRLTSDVHHPAHPSLLSSSPPFRSRPLLRSLHPTTHARQPQAQTSYLLDPLLRIVSGSAASTGRWRRGVFPPMPCDLLPVRFQSRSGAEGSTRCIGGSTPTSLYLPPLIPRHGRQRE